MWYSLMNETVLRYHHTICLRWLVHIYMSANGNGPICPQAWMVSHFPLKLYSFCCTRCPHVLATNVSDNRCYSELPPPRHTSLSLPAGGRHQPLSLLPSGPAHSLPALSGAKRRCVDPRSLRGPTHRLDQHCWHWPISRHVVAGDLLTCHPAGHDCASRITEHDSGLITCPGGHSRPAPHGLQP